MNYDDEDKLMMMALLGAGATVLSLDVTHKPNCKRGDECSCEPDHHMSPITIDDLSDEDAS